MDSDNSSSVCCPSSSSSPPLRHPSFPSTASPPPSEAEVAALRLLSSNLSSLFYSLSPSSSSSSPFSDAIISAPSCIPPSTREIPVHRCLLAARSPFFREKFASAGADARKFEIGDLVRDVDIRYDSLLVVLGYIYTGNVEPLPKGGICECADPECPHVGCRPAVDFLLQALYASFTFQIPELGNLFQRHLLDILDKVSEDDMLDVLSIANRCEKNCDRLLAKSIEFVTDSNIDVATLERRLPPDIVKQITDFRLKLGKHEPDCIAFPDKHVRRIHRALDSDDVELVRMLLKESQTTLDDACALHYAVAHCDSKITTELLDIGLADVNHRNSRGYTVLHVAAMRREPKIIVSLLAKGARPSDVTKDGRKALQISMRLTRLADFNRMPEEGLPSHNDRLCIEVLENAERANPLVGEAAISLAIAGDELRSRLLYLENRVGLAKFLFPKEAHIATEIARVPGTLEFSLGTDFGVSPGSKSTIVDDLNEAPFRIKEERLLRMKALERTVELAKRYFPRCTRILDRIMDDDTADLAFRADETSEERQRKKKRYQELQDSVSKAFSEDREEFSKSTLSSASSSTTLNRARSKLARK